MSCADEEIKSVINFLNEKAILYYHYNDSEFNIETSFYKHHKGVVEVSESNSKILIVFKNRYGLLHRNDGPAFINYDKKYHISKIMYYIEGVEQNELKFLVALYSDEGDICEI